MGALAKEVAMTDAKGKLKRVDTKEGIQLPTSSCIEAEKSAEAKAQEVLMAKKASLSSAATAEKNRLPSAVDIQAEKESTATADAQEKLMQKKESLKPAITLEKNRLPSAADIAEEKKG